MVVTGGEKEWMGVEEGKMEGVSGVREKKGKREEGDIPLGVKKI